MAIACHCWRTAVLSWPDPPNILGAIPTAGLPIKFANGPPDVRLSISTSVIASIVMPCGSHRAKSIQPVIVSPTFIGERLGPCGIFTPTDETLMRNGIAEPNRGSATMKRTSTPPAAYGDPTPRTMTPVPNWSAANGVPALSSAAKSDDDDHMPPENGEPLPMRLERLKVYIPNGEPWPFKPRIPLGTNAPFANRTPALAIVSKSDVEKTPVANGTPALASVLRSDVERKAPDANSEPLPTSATGTNPPLGNRPTEYGDPVPDSMPMIA